MRNFLCISYSLFLREINQKVQNPEGYRSESQRPGIWLIRVDVQQGPPQCCEVTVLQLNK